MKKEYRIKKNEEFQKIIRQKKSIVHSKFVIYFRKNDEHLRIGISVSKKLGNAVVRNKIKRQIRMMISSQRKQKRVRQLPKRIPLIFPRIRSGRIR